MQKTKTNSIEDSDNGITINLKKSSLAEFTKRPVPNERDVENFEKIIEDQESEMNPPLDEDLDEEIEESHTFIKLSVGQVQEEEVRLPEEYIIQE